jgi:hypothetical protein
MIMGCGVAMLVLLVEIWVRGSIAGHCKPVTSITRRTRYGFVA